MIRVPTTAQPAQPQRPQVPDQYLLMAAATMHEMGRLTPQQQGTQLAETDTIPYESLSPKEQKDAVKGSRELQEGPELNKWDEALQEYKSIILPSSKEYGPVAEKYMNKDTQRIDLPDGRMILRKKQKAPLTS